MIKLAVLGSTNGTDLRAIMAAISKGVLDAEVSVVISNRKSAYIPLVTMMYRRSLYHIKKKLEKHLMPR
jgi:folate-dependent phosphoribosylglycinamide formyltransferase PurN